MIKQLISWVRRHSPFYQDLYSHLPDEVELSDLPVLNSDDFWDANGLETNRVLTGRMQDGLILRSGGTTGRPKFSVFSKSEWNAFTHAFAKALSQTGVQPGDRFANMFYSGQLYGSFLFTHKIIEECPTPLLSLPIGGETSCGDALKIMQDFAATVLSALPTTIMALIDYLDSHPQTYDLKLRLILFAGEAMYPDQRARVQRVLPGVQIRSIGYASNDAGFLGYADPNCGPNEFRRHDSSTLYEIIDEITGQPILEMGREGRSVLTDLRRRLMPIIRYPVGDRAMWMEPDGTTDRKFKLVGRAEEAARIASLSLYYEDFRKILERFQQIYHLTDLSFQFVIRHENSKDGLTIRIGASHEVLVNGNALNSKLLEALYLEQKIIKAFEEQNKILKTQIEWIQSEELEINSRSGKLRRIIDLR